MCHGDIVCFLGMASSYPRVPGHEIAGVIDAVGAGVKRFQVRLQFETWLVGGQSAYFGQQRRLEVSIRTAGML